MASTVFDPIIAEITELTSTVDGVEAFIADLKTKVDASPTLEDAQAVVSLAVAQRSRLSKAIVTNTPDDPNPASRSSRRGS